MRKFYAAALAVAIVVPLIVMTEPAGAAAIVSCKTPTGSLTFAPGITPVAKVQTVKFTVSAKGCTGIGGVKSVTSSGSSKYKTSCAAFSKSVTVPMSVKFTWNTGKTSTASLADQVIDGSTITATVSGKIGAGLFKGKSVKAKFKVTIPLGSCGKKPLTTGTLTALSPLTIS